VWGVSAREANERVLHIHITRVQFFARQATPSQAEEFTVDSLEFDSLFFLITRRARSLALSFSPGASCVTSISGSPLLLSQFRPVGANQGGLSGEDDGANVDLKWMLQTVAYALPATQYETIFR